LNQSGSVEEVNESLAQWLGHEPADCRGKSWLELLAQRSLFVRLLRTESQLESLVRRWPGVIFSQRADFSFQFSGAFLLAEAKDHDYAWLLDEANRCRCRWRLNPISQSLLVYV